MLAALAFAAAIAGSPCHHRAVERISESVLHADFDRSFDDAFVDSFVASADLTEMEGARAMVAAFWLPLFEPLRDRLYTSMIAQLEHEFVADLTCPEMKRLSKVMRNGDVALASVPESQRDIAQRGMVVFLKFPAIAKQVQAEPWVVEESLALVGAHAAEFVEKVATLAPR